MLRTLQLQILQLRKAFCDVERTILRVRRGFLKGLDETLEGHNIADGPLLGILELIESAPSTRLGRSALLSHNLASIRAQLLSRRCQ